MERDFSPVTVNLKNPGNPFLVPPAPLGFLFVCLFVCLSSLKDTLLLLLEGDEGRGRNIDMREKCPLIASHTCPDQGSFASGPGIKPTT